MSFAKNYFDIDLNGDKLITFYILPKGKLLPNDMFQTVILKFVHFHEKADFRTNGSCRKYCVNPLNGKNIWLKERLPSVEALLKQYTDEMNLITATKNCNVSVLCHDNE